MIKLSNDVEIASYKLRWTTSVLTVDEANTLITEIKQADFSKLKSLATKLSKFKNSLNVLRKTGNENYVLHGVSDESYQAVNVFLSIVARLINCKQDYEFNDISKVAPRLELLQHSKFDRSIENIEYNITAEDYLKCAGVSDYLVRTALFPERRENFVISAPYSAYEVLKPQRASGVLMTENLIEELKSKYDADLAFNSETEIPFMDKIDDKYRTLKAKFKGSATGKESLCCELVEITHKFFNYKQFDFDKLPVGVLNLLDCKGDLDVR